MVASLVARRDSSVLQMGAKGDGKKRRKKAEPASAPPSGTAKPTPPSSPSPPARSSAAGRVDGDNLLSVRKQIALAKAYKSWQQSTPTRVVRTSFRKSKDAMQEKAYAKDETELPPGKFDVSSLPILLVDGYNVIGLWP